MILESPLTQTDDGQLVEAARQDPRAFEMLYRRHVTDVYRYCYVKCGNKADAEDLTAQTFLGALEGLPAYRGRASFPAWLFAIARRKCADYHRRHYRRLQESLEIAAALPDPAAADPEHRAYLRGVLDCVRRVLGQLTPDRREALELRFWAGLSVQETAQVMKRRQGAVKMLTMRAIDDLKERCLHHE